MRRNLALLNILLVGAGLSLATPVLAEPGGDVEHPVGPSYVEPHWYDHEGALQTALKMVDLSHDQKSRIHAIWDSPGMTESAKTEAIYDVLTPEQRREMPTLLRDTHYRLYWKNYPY